MLDVHNIIEVNRIDVLLRDRPELLEMFKILCNVINKQINNDNDNRVRSFNEMDAHDLRDVYVFVSDSEDEIMPDLVDHSSDDDNLIIDDN